MSAEPSCAESYPDTLRNKDPSGEPTKLNAHFQNLSQRGCTKWNAPQTQKHGSFISGIS